MYAKSTLSSVSESCLYILLCFISLVITAFGWPFPEEFSLIWLGILINQEHAPWFIGWIVGLLGVTGGDVIAWYFGLKVGLEPTGFISRLIGKEQIEDIERFYRKWGNWAIVIARQLPGMRFPTFFFAGASAVPFSRFYLIDGLAALVTVNVYFWIGYAIGAKMEFEKGDSIQDLGEKVTTNLPWLEVFIRYGSQVAGLIIGLIILRIVFQRFKKRSP